MLFVRMKTCFVVRQLCALPLLVTLLTPLLSHPVTAQKNRAIPKPYSAKPSTDALKWADKELRRMSLDEKIGQLISVGINATFLNQDSDAFKTLRHHIEDNH